MLLQVYVTLSLMYMPSFIAVSVVVFKLLEYYQLKCGNPHICVFSAVQIEDFANFKTL